MKLIPLCSLFFFKKMNLIHCECMSVKWCWNIWYAWYLSASFLFHFISFYQIKAFRSAEQTLWLMKQLNPAAMEQNVITSVLKRLRGQPMDRDAVMDCLNSYNHINATISFSSVSVFILLLLKPYNIIYFFQYGIVSFAKISEEIELSKS